MFVPGEGVRRVRRISHANTRKGLAAGIRTGGGALSGSRWLLSSCHSVGGGVSNSSLRPSLAGELCAGCVAELRGKGLSDVCPLCREPLPPGAVRLYDLSVRVVLKIDRAVGSRTRLERTKQQHQAGPRTRQGHRTEAPVTAGLGTAGASVPAGRLAQVRVGCGASRWRVGCASRWRVGCASGWCVGCARVDEIELEMPPTVPTLRTTRAIPVPRRCAIQRVDYHRASP